MKTLKFSLLALAAAFGLASCQKTADVEPQAPVRSPESALRDGGGLIPAKQYLLTKAGQVTLQYLPDGRLQKATYNHNGPYGYTDDYTDYNYGGFLSITSKTYSGGKLSNESLYLINVGTGWCYESDSKSYSYVPNGVIVTQKVHKYEYNAKGQLTKKYLKNKPNERSEFSYDANGDLQKVVHFDASGVATTQNEHYYNLGTVNNPNLIPDKCRLNPSGAFMPDEYLQIFGKFQKHLMAAVVFEKFTNGQQYQITSGRVFQYTLNADGYVSLRKDYRSFTGNGVEFVGDVPYEYLVK